jgi:hypothetical protein
MKNKKKTKKKTTKPAPTNGKITVPIKSFSRDMLSYPYHTLFHTTFD